MSRNAKFSWRGFGDASGVVPTVPTVRCERRFDRKYKMITTMRISDATGSKTANNTVEVFPTLFVELEAVSPVVPLLVVAEAE
jgi:hypothetical protein